MTAKTIYVAGASAEPERVRKAMNVVKELGLEITLDWLAVIEAEGAANEGLNDAKRRKYAFADLDAVDRADIVWVLAPTPPNGSTGCWAELGYAIKGGKDIVVSGVGRARCIFAVLALREFDDDKEAFALIERWADDT